MEQDVHGNKFTGSGPWVLPCTTWLERKHCFPYMRDVLEESLCFTSMKDGIDKCCFGKTKHKD